MVFSSPLFLFFFLPAVLLGFLAVPARARTPFLLAASLIFYAWGEGPYLWLLLTSIVCNWGLALAVDAAERPGARRALLAAAAAVNIGALVYFKYANFIVDNVRRFHPLPATHVHLPIGISFITFEALSYVVDVYRRHTRARRNPVDVGFYISFFPHLIAGPILRFDDVADRLRSPRPSADYFESGVRSFIVGLGKKVLLANTLARLADAVFHLPAAELGAASAWAGAIAYALQIYFDFSGYSDMAIGLGRMCGFELPRNFDLPYSSASIKEFWRRWHISLSRWFRDYLYIPLGGNRGSTASGYRNLVLVFFLCGLWHGASWTFVVWGLYHGLFLVLERTRFGSWLDRRSPAARHAYALLVVLIGWVFFRADSFGQAASMLQAMAGLGAGGTALRSLLDRELILAFVVAVPLSVLPINNWIARLTAAPAGGAPPGAGFLRAASLLAILVVCAAYLAAGTYNPFIYFRF